MKTYGKQITAGVMVFAMAVTMAGAGYNDRELGSVKAAESDADVLTEAAAKVLNGSEGADAETKGLYKDETVYVMASPKGKAKKTTVSEWLKNPGSERGLSDVSDLKKIKNVKGEETFTTGEGGALTWDTAGEDIYYQGNTDKTLPVEVTIGYKLDGKAISAKDLKGKSGKVEIHIQYKNTSRQMTEVNGEQTEMYTPFTMVTGVILPANEYQNISVDSGKIISDADKNIVLGLGFPGLKENLDLKDADIDLPDGVTITADVKKASVGTTITVASSEIMEEFGLNDVNDFDSLESSIDGLSDASSQLKEGAGTLADGVNMLNSKTGTLKGGVNELADGVNAYAGGVEQLTSGSQDVAGAAAMLCSKLEEAKTGAASLKSGADQLTAGVENAGRQLSGGIASIQSGVDQLNGIVNGASGASKASVTEDSKSAAVTAAVDTLAAEGIIADEERDAAADAIASAMGNVTATADTSQIEAMKGAVTSLKSGVDSYTSGVSGAFSELSSGASQLQTGLNTLNDGSAALSSGAETLSSGASSLSAGAAALNKNSSLLKTGASSLKDGSSQLTDGVGQLAEGADTLAAGMSEFKTTGIDKLAEVFEGDISQVTNRIGAMTELGKSYKSFSGIADGMDGSTKFIIETKAVE